MVQTNKRFIQKLQSQFSNNKSFGTVIKAGLSNIVPAPIENFDFETFKRTMEIAKKWNSNMIFQVEKLLKNALSINFEPKFNMNGHVFGIVIVKLKDKTIRRLNEMLLMSRNVEYLDDKEFYERLVKSRKGIEEPKVMVEPDRHHSIVIDRSKFSSSSSSMVSQDVRLKEPKFVEPERQHSKIIDRSQTKFCSSSSVVVSQEICSKEPKFFVTIPEPKSNQLKKIDTIRSSVPSQTTEVLSKKSSKPKTRIPEKNNFMPICYDQVLGQEARPLLLPNSRATHVKTIDQNHVQKPKIVPRKYHGATSSDSDDQLPCIDSKWKKLLDVSKETSFDVQKEINQKDSNQK